MMSILNNLNIVFFLASFAFIILFVMVILLVILMVRLKIYKTQIDGLTSIHNVEVERLSQLNTDFKNTGALQAVEKVDSALGILSRTITGMSDSNVSMVKEISEIRTHYSEVKRLAKLIGNTTLSGKWSEDNFENLLARILPGHAYNIQSRNSLNKIPDFSLPFNFNGAPSMLFVDAKTNISLIEKYNDALNAQNESETLINDLKTARKNLALALKNQVHKISEDYLKARESMPFAICYIPFDGWVNLIYNEFSEEVASFQSDNVLLMGPTGIVPLIKMLQGANAHAARRVRAFENFGLIHSAILKFQDELGNLSEAVEVPESTILQLSKDINTFGRRVRSMKQEMETLLTVVIKHIPIPEANRPETEDGEKLI